MYAMLRRQPLGARSLGVPRRSSPAAVARPGRVGQTSLAARRPASPADVAHLAQPQTASSPGERSLRPLRATVDEQQGRTLLLVAAAGLVGSRNDLFLETVSQRLVEPREFPSRCVVECLERKSGIGCLLHRSTLWDVWS